MDNKGHSVIVCDNGTGVSLYNFSMTISEVGILRLVKYCCRSWKVATRRFRLVLTIWVLAFYFIKLEMQTEFVINNAAFTDFQKMSFKILLYIFKSLSSVAFSKLYRLRML